MSNSCKTKTDLEMENVRLRRKLMEAEERVERMRPTEKERRILDMLPRFDDDEPVWLGDEVGDFGGEIVDIHFDEKGAAIWNNACDHLHLGIGECVNRPAPEALDADGVPIKKGEILQGTGRSQHMFKVFDPHDIDPVVGCAFSVRCLDLDDEEECYCRPELLTHTRPDSWERLEGDAMNLMPKYWGCSFEPCDECPSKIDGKTPAEIYGVSSCSTAKELDIIRRAKALAGVGR